MSLLITITKAPEAVALAESSKSFDVQGGSIGRGKDNAWVLDDPERFLSSVHCQITNESGQFFITDMSTNGTFFNGAATPMGKGNKQPLNDGDLFTLGDYEFTVSLWNPTGQSMSSSQPATPQQENIPSGPFGGGGANPANDLFSTPSGNDFAAGSDPFGGGHVSSSEPLFSTTPEETDPLAALDKAQGDIAGGFGQQPDPFTAPAADPFAANSFSDQADPLNQQVSWPDAVPEQSGPTGGGVIPDDWDDDLLSPSPAQPQQPSSSIPPVQPAMAIQAPPAQEPAPQPQPRGAQAIEPSIPLTQPPRVPRPGNAPEAEASVKQTAKPVDFQATGEFDVTQGEISSTQQKALEKANKKIQAELEILKRQVNSQKRNVTKDVSVDTTLIDALGFTDHNLGDEEITQINELTGTVMREMVAGLMQVLGSRSSIKNEFRMNVTTIQPVENNPLKFSANVDDALENMFIKQGNAYKKPVEAVQEGFESIAEHQVAILAGIRAAFRGVIERFDPVLLEERFSKQNKGGIIPGSQKAKNWELFVDYYNELAGDIDNSFQYLFGDEFVQAYEDQLQKLTIARKTKKSKKD